MRGTDGLATRPATALAAGLVALGRLLASGSTNLDQTNALVWVMVAISAAGSIVTFGFLVYSVFRFRDPRTKRRRYG